MTMLNYVKAKSRPVSPLPASWSAHSYNHPLAWLSTMEGFLTYLL